MVESSTDAVSAARAATGRMIDLLVARWGFEDVHAYILCSAAMNLHFAQVVNEPMFTVTASIAKGVLPRSGTFLRPCSERLPWAGAHNEICNFKIEIPDRG